MGVLKGTEASELSKKLAYNAKKASKKAQTSIKQTSRQVKKLAKVSEKARQAAGRARRATEKRQRATKKKYAAKKASKRAATQFVNATKISGVKQDRYESEKRGQSSVGKVVATRKKALSAGKRQSKVALGKLNKQQARLTKDQAKWGSLKDKVKALSKQGSEADKATVSFKRMLAGTKTHLAKFKKQIKSVLFKKMSRLQSKSKAASKKAAKASGIKKTADAAVKVAQGVLKKAAKVLKEAKQARKAAKPGEEGKKGKKGKKKRKAAKEAYKEAKGVYKKAKRKHSEDKGAFATAKANAASAASRVKKTATASKEKAAAVSEQVTAGKSKTSKMNKKARAAMKQLDGQFAKLKGKASKLALGLKQKKIAATVAASKVKSDKQGRNAAQKSVQQADLRQTDAQKKMGAARQSSESRRPRLSKQKTNPRVQSEGKSHPKRSRREHRKLLLQLNGPIKRQKRSWTNRRPEHSAIALEPLLRKQNYRSSRRKPRQMGLMLRRQTRNRKRLQ